MRPILPESGVFTDDVLYHPAMGFARVTAAGPDGFVLEWEQASHRLPRRVSIAAARKGYQICPRGGFFARSLLDREALRALVQDEPGRALHLLLADLDVPQRPPDVRDWLVGRKLLDEDLFTNWWASLPLDDNPRFEIRQGRVGLPVPGDDVPTSPLDAPPAPLFELSREDSDALELMRPPEDELLPDGARLWAQLDRLEGDELLASGAALMEALALRHTTGRPIGLREDRVAGLPDGGVALLNDAPAPAHLSLADDLLEAGVLLLERVMMRPLPPGLSPDELLPFLAALAPPLPPAALALIEPLLAHDPDLRPESALEPAALWAAARVHERLRASAAPNPGARLRVGADTHIGRSKMLTRQTNQDAFGLRMGDHRGLLVVADGISVSDAGSGDEASALSVDSLLRSFERHEHGLPDTSGKGRAVLEAWLRDANRAVCDAVLEHCHNDLTGRIPMGTTVVMAWVDGDRVDLASLGDSRIYLVTPFGAAQLTPDQNVWLERLRGPGDPRDFQDPGAALTGYLGYFDPEDRPTLCPAWHRRLRLLPGETLILLTDGIVDYAAPSPAAFGRLLCELCAEHDPQGVASALVNAANQGGGGDNATVVVATLSGSDGP
ncbi:MAG: serine/threonine-protein phosphatase [Alphaproteobacteria bacterium]|nr:serine/threonine-protein phosphatase [Alphaproteobacteria bacterium]